MSALVKKLGVLGLRGAAAGARRPMTRFPAGAQQFMQYGRWLSAQAQSMAAPEAATVEAGATVKLATEDAKAAPKSKVRERKTRVRKAVMTVSERAAERVRELMQGKDPAPAGIRLGVRTRGCNGLSYTMNYVDDAPKLDDVVEADGIKVFIDPKAVMFLVGSHMDFYEDAVKAEFVFNNPNAKGSCGCGESFNV